MKWFGKERKGKAAPAEAAQVPQMTPDLERALIEGLQDPADTPRQSMSGNEVEGLKKVVGANPFQADRVAFFAIKKMAEFVQEGKTGHQTGLRQLGVWGEELGISWDVFKKIIGMQYKDVFPSAVGSPPEAKEEEVVA